MRILTTLLLMLCGHLQAANRYVDSGASGTNSGTLANPWLTLADINYSTLNAGDTLFIKRGRSYAGQINFTRSGSAGNPIVITAYGTGTDPLLWGTGSTITYLFYFNNRSYVTVSDLRIADTTISATDRSVLSKIQRAFYLDGTTNNVVIKRCTVDRAGIGAYLVGPNNTVDSCTWGNLRMVVNTNDGAPPGADDDYGANPLVISSANNTITHNYFYDCWAESFDYGYDGGIIEFFGGGTDDNFIAYNTFRRSVGLSEITGNSSGNIYAYNKMVGMGSLFFFQSGSTYSNYQFYNNTVVEDSATFVPEVRMIGGLLASGTLVLKNNIFKITNGVDVAGSTSGITHTYNLYKLSGGSAVGYTLSTGELTTSAQIWATETGSPINYNYYLAPGSAAINAGTSIAGLTVDFNGAALAGAISMGILQYTAPGSCAGCYILINTIIK